MRLLKVMTFLSLSHDTLSLPYHLTEGSSKAPSSSPVVSKISFG